MEFEQFRIDILSFEIETINNILKSVSEFNFLEVRSEEFSIYLEGERKKMLVKCLKAIKDNFIKEVNELKSKGVNNENKNS